MNFDKARKFSVETFAKYVAPILRENLDIAEVHDTEILDEEKFKKLDCKNCIDGYFVTIDGKTEYFSSRVQQGFYPSFTVRRSRDTGKTTEFDKLCKLIENGGVYPKWTIQTYVQDDKVTMAIVDTEQLINFILATNPPVRRTNFDQSGQSDFYVCYWTALKNFGVNVQVFSKKLK